MCICKLGKVKPLKKLLHSEVVRLVFRGVSFMRQLKIWDIIPIRTRKISTP